MRSKIALIGGGGIGSMLASMICSKFMSNIVICDITDGLPEGRSLDLCQAMAVDGSDHGIYGISGDSSSIEGADVCVVTAGVARKQGMTREDLLSINKKVMVQVGENIRKYAPDAFVICVTNPLDAMVSVLQHASKLPASHVVGMAGVLDSARFSFLLSRALNISTADIQTIVLGGHGDTMVPVVSYTTVSGIPLSEFVKDNKITNEQIDSIVQRVRDGGVEIVNYLKNGSAVYAPAASALCMIRSYLEDQKRVLCCSVKLSGQYGYNDIYFGMPAVIGKNGVERILEPTLSDYDIQQVRRSASKVCELMEMCECI